MTSTITIGPEQQRLEGRTVRDIVEHDPAQVNEVWCRKIFRQLLQSLELQYAMHMPHRAITPDTVVFHDNGEPLLLPTAIDDGAPDEAADLGALARLVHFAITRELAPAGPLRGRQLEGYSDSLLTAVDRCMSLDPAERPRSIAELRHILGIVALGPVPPAPPLVPSAAAPIVTPTAPRTVPLDAPFTGARPGTKIVSAAAPAVPAADPLPSFMHAPDAGPLRRAGGLTRWQRGALAGGGGAFLLAVALALFAELRDSGSYDHIVLTLPQSAEQARSDAASGPPPLAAQQAPAAAQIPAFQDGAAAPAYPAGAPQASARPNAAGPAASASYHLLIQPWGVVYVDGIDRGVSPPVKRLVLTPGKHTLRIANPNFHDRVLEVDTSAGGGRIAVDFNDEPR